MDLNGKWTLTGVLADGRSFSAEASVPGCVHTDLLQNGLIEDPFYRDNSKMTQWIENGDFTYTRRFCVSSLQERAYLEFDGLDTYCDVILNGQKIAHCEDMHIPYAFPVDGILQEGENVLSVQFHSPVRAVEGLPKLSGAFTCERMHTRRMQCTYGWDWVDRFVTMGIFRDVRLAFRKKNEIESAYLYTNDINPYSAQLALKILLRDFEPCEDQIRIELLAPDGRTVFSKQRTVIRRDINEFIDVPAPELWYPNGYGKQPLYTLRLEGANRKEFRFGIRKLVLLEQEDQPGSAEEAMTGKIRAMDMMQKIDHNRTGAGFTVLVNDVKIMCKGGNWVPCDPFPSNEAPEKITRLLELAARGGVNLLRVWGGGIFERDTFYEECDRLGILVTQDFLMACGAYPETEDWFIRALNAEAEAAALRLRNHPCLAWWSGDNENATWGSENRSGFRGYLSATLGVQPVLEKLDPQRRFLPSSPYGGDRYASATRGTTHYTFYLGAFFNYVLQSDFSDYRDFFNSQLCRFNVEQPAIGMPFVSSLRKFLTEEDIFGDDTSMSEFHTKNNPGLGDTTIYQYADILSRKIFGDFTDGEDRVRKMQMLQCEWARLSMELYRRNKWYSSGIVFWMYNDCWPAANGWSFVDYYANPKPAYYTFKRCAKPVIASVLLESGALNVFVCNDSLSPASGLGSVYVYDFKKDAVLCEKTFSYSVDANTSRCVMNADASDFERFFGADTVVLCETDHDRCFLIPKRYRDLDLTYGAVRVVEIGKETVTVCADEFTPFAIVDVPYELEENCFLMKKGETRTVRILGALQ